MVEWHFDWEITGSSVVICDMGRNYVREVSLDPEKGEAAVAGVPWAVQSDHPASDAWTKFEDGPADSAKFNFPTSVALTRPGPRGGRPRVIELASDECLFAYDRSHVFNSSCAVPPPGGTFVNVTRLRLLYPDQPRTESSPPLLFVSDTSNHCVRVVDTQGRQVRTIAGRCTVPGFQDGFTQNGRLRNPASLGRDFEGRVYIHDAGNKSIRILDLPEEFRDIESFVRETRLKTLKDGACVDLPFWYSDNLGRINRNNYRYSLCYRDWLTGEEVSHYYNFTRIDHFCTARFDVCHPELLVPF